MSRLILAVISAALAITPATAQRITLAQLHHVLAAQKEAHKSDRDMAKKALSIELSEQLTAPALEHLKSELQPGPKTVEALDLLRDVSSFLDPPSDELPPNPPPDADTRSKMFRQAVEFAAVTMRRMPNFLATRNTLSFDDRPLLASNTGWTPAHTGLHLEGAFTQQITYRNGQEVSQNALPEASNTPTPPDPSTIKIQPSPSGLTTTGEFGPILALVLTDSLDGSITWSHWEQTPAGLASVFHFAVPVDASHYSVNFCWLLRPIASSYRHINDMADASTNCYKGKPAYHGSLSMDPSTGAVFRIVLECDLAPSQPMQRAAVSVQYGTVDIGGSSYVCPLRSAAISVVRFPERADVPSRTITRVNAATFTDYHRFGSTARMVPNPTAQ